mgnify:FL=1|jgi:hypothetical protein|tara:strand:- start:1439 stop:1819 length:381 start_codon:yes stop_codon:yes gene_type:complete
MFHKINEDKQVKAGKGVELYTISGKQSWKCDAGYPRLDDDKEEHFDCYAKKITVGSRTKFYVKRGRHGKLFNPIGMYSEGMAKKQLRHAGRPEWEFKETNEQVFTKYIKFLKTKNTAWLNNAERES